VDIAPTIEEILRHAGQVLQVGLDGKKGQIGLVGQYGLKTLQSVL